MNITEASTYLKQVVSRIERLSDLGQGVQVDSLLFLCTHLMIRWAAKNRRVDGWRSCAADSVRTKKAKDLSLFSNEKSQG